MRLSHSSRAWAHCRQKLSPGEGQGRQGLPEASWSVCQPLCGPFTSICMREPPVSPPNGSWALQFTEKGTDLPRSHRKSWTGLGFESWCIRTRVLPLLVVPTPPSELDFAVMKGWPAGEASGHRSPLAESCGSGRTAVFLKLGCAMGFMHLFIICELWCSFQQTHIRKLGRGSSRGHRGWGG